MTTVPRALDSRAQLKLSDVADRFDLRRDVQFETRVISAVLDEDDG
jgi:cation diffusion facilitator CzcD-associated flavoprotein CzcO